MFQNFVIFVTFSLQESFAGYTIYAVGSTISGFGSDLSDVDMCLLHSGTNGPIYVGNDLRFHSAKILKDFEELLKRNGNLFEYKQREIELKFFRYLTQLFMAISI